ncbi:MAG: hypothetical protein AAF394_05425, partial [Planctomycetota bacterium]
MELREAVRQISDIRQQMASSEVFRGYRSLTVGFSGLLGILAACIQPYLLSNPIEQLTGYIAFWFGVAVVSLVVAGTEMYWRAYRAGPGMARDSTILAAKQFLPCVVVGAFMTLCIVQNAPQVGWMLPGLWSLIYAQGVFASYRLLPREAVWVGVYFTACGCLCLLEGQGDFALSAWLMGGGFGGGQLLAAGIL